MTLVFALMGLFACTDPTATDPDDGPQGTFIGNPGLSARYIDNEVQVGRGGELVSQELHVHGCDGTDDVALGAAAFSFDGSLSIDAAQIPPGEYCEIFVVVQALTVTFDDVDLGRFSITGRDYDLFIPGPFVATQGGSYVAQLGDETWLEELVSVANPGQNDVADDPTLASVWFDGLENRSSISSLASEAPPDLAGRVDFAQFPTSPLNTETTLTTCGPQTFWDLAVPIPPASMAARFPGVSALGWCEGPVDFPLDLTEQLAIQYDLSDGSTYEVPYNGFGDGCTGLHCGSVHDEDGIDLGMPCTVLAMCEAVSGNATVTGFDW